VLFDYIFLPLISINSVRGNFLSAGSFTLSYAIVATMMMMMMMMMIIIIIIIIIINWNYGT